MSDRLCLNCNAAVTSRHKTVKFCCHACSVAYRAQDLGTRKCSQCENEFKITSKNPTQEYCGRKCAHDSMCRKISVVCEVCNEEFFAQRNQVNKGNARFCGRKCFHVWHTKHMTENPSVPRNKTECSCSQCGKIFERWPSVLGREDMNGGRFCSRSCTHKWQRTIVGINHPLDRKITCTCVWCKKNYRAKRVHKETTKFCSRQCQGAYTSHHAGRKETSIEATIRLALDEMRIQYIQEKPLGPYVCDFYIECDTRKVVIECDGVYWHNLPSAKRTDKRKNGWMRTHGYTIVRLPEEKIKNDIEWCRLQIQHAIA
jgi:very-short-patch-repair endonuclease